MASACVRVAWLRIVIFGTIASGRSEPFIAFAEKAASQKGSDLPPLKSPKDFKIMGQNVARFDIPSKVDGTAVFGIDVDLPNMQYATVKAGSVIGSTVVSFDASKAENMPGVTKVVNLDTAIAVIAKSYWQAKKALAQVDVEFSTSEANKLTNESMFAQFARDMDAAIENGDEQKDHKQGDARGVLAAASEVIEAEYRVPHLAHATMEPMNATALSHDGKLELWSGLQNPLGIRDMLADALDMDKYKVIIHNVLLGGGFGRRASDDYPYQAAKLAQAMPGVPVKMVWSREEDTQQDFYRPAVLSRFKASLDSEGYPQAWENQFVDKHEPVEAPTIPYAVENQFIHYTDSPTHVRFGAWRSVDHTQHAFFHRVFLLMS